MNLSEHFTLEELTVTQTGHANVPDAAHKVELVRLCNTVLEPMRALLGVPITIDSGGCTKRSTSTCNTVPTTNTSANADGQRHHRPRRLAVPAAA